jgi:hypothetical protein
MEKDRLEKFVINHRDEFDEFMPDPAVFGRIRKPKPVVRMINWNSVMWKAAAVLVIFVASYYFHDFVNSRKRPQTAENETGKPTEIVKMMIEAEAFYTAQIDNRQQEFNALAQDQPEIRHEVNYELVALDSVYADLKRDLKDNAANEEVIEAMIQNYRVKLDILEDVLRQLRAAKNELPDSNRDKQSEI